MPRSVDINYVRLRSTPTTSFDPATNVGVIFASYVAGHAEDRTVTLPDGTTQTGPVYEDVPQLTLVGTVSIPLNATDVAGARFQAMVDAIMDQEQLSVADGDQFLTS